MDIDVLQLRVGPRLIPEEHRFLIAELTLFLLSFDNVKLWVLLSSIIM